MLIQNFNTKKDIFLIAEIGNNHEGKFELAKKLIYLAKKNGAHAVKFQYIDPEKLVNKIIYPDRVKFLKKICLNYDDFLKLKKYADKLKIIFLCSIFDKDKIEKFSQILPAFKIASSENNDIETIIKISKNNKPILISTGMLTNVQIRGLMKKINLKSNMLKKLCLMHCVSNYPLLNKDANIAKLEFLKKFNVQIGYSDHTIGINACLIAASLGARVIEKHFTIDHNYSDFRDHKLSMNPDELKILSKSLIDINTLIGKNINNIPYSDKIIIKNNRRGIYAKTNIKKNKIIKKSDLVLLRPKKENGVENLKKIIGRRSRVNLNKLDEVSFRLTSKK